MIAENTAAKHRSQHQARRQAQGFNQRHADRDHQGEGAPAGAGGETDQRAGHKKHGHDKDQRHMFPGQSGDKGAGAEQLQARAQRQRQQHNQHQLQQVAHTRKPDLDQIVVAEPAADQHHQIADQGREHCGIEDRLRSIPVSNFAVAGPVHEGENTADQHRERVHHIAGFGGANSGRASFSVAACLSARGHGAVPLGAQHHIEDDGQSDKGIEIQWHRSHQDADRAIDVIGADQTQDVSPPGIEHNQDADRGAGAVDDIGEPGPAHADLSNRPRDRMPAVSTTEVGFNEQRHAGQGGHQPDPRAARRPAPN